MLNTLNKQKGFTLLELMIVVIIIGVLAAIAIPRFASASTSSKQTEAKVHLKQMYTAQRTYFQEHDTYWIPAGGTVASSSDPLAFAQLGVKVNTPARYSFSITGNQTSFTITATSSVLDDDATIDIWTIDNNGDLKVVTDDVHN